MWVVGVHSSVGLISTLILKNQNYNHTSRLVLIFSSQKMHRVKVSVVTTEEIDQNLFMLMTQALVQFFLKMHSLIGHFF
jgi:hypothetical protein